MILYYSTSSKCKEFRNYFKYPQDLNNLFITYNPILIYIILDKFNDDNFAYYRVVRKYQSELGLKGEPTEFPLNNYLTLLKEIIKQIYNIQ